MHKLGMRDALRRLARPGAGNVPLIRSVSQTSFHVEGNTAFGSAVREAAKWMRNRNASIPPEALLGIPFEIGGGGDHPAQAVTLSFEDGRVWAGSLDFADTNTLGRTWVTELTVAEQAGQTHFGARLINVTRGEDAPFLPTVPGIVRQIIKQVRAVADDIELNEDAVRVDHPDTVDELIALLDDPSRSLPVVVVADGQDWKPVANAALLAQKLAGVAHVYSLSQAGATEFRNRFGRLLSVYGGGARVYKTGFSSELSNPFDHKLWPAARIHIDRTSDIISAVLTISVSKVATRDYPRFTAIRQASARAVATERLLAGYSDLRELFEEENERLEVELRALRGEFDQWLAEVDLERAGLERALAETKADAARYRSQAEGLRAALASGVAPSKQPLADFEGFEEWAAQNLAESMWISPKAFKAMEKNGQFENPKLIGDVLLMMDELYVPMRKEPSDERRSTFVARLMELGCSERPCFSNQNEIKGHPQYSVVYQGEKIWCDIHIKYGGGTDPRRMFRVYYTWHEPSQTLIIGHMPTHLDNNLTN